MSSPEEPYARLPPYFRPPPGGYPGIPVCYVGLHLRCLCLRPSVPSARLADILAVGVAGRKTPFRTYAQAWLPLPATNVPLWMAIFCAVHIGLLQEASQLGPHVQ